MDEIKVKQIRELVECGAKVVYVPSGTIDETLARHAIPAGYHSDVYGWAWDLWLFDGIYVVTGYHAPRVKGIIKPGKVKELRKLDFSYNKYNSERVKNAIIELL